MNKVPSALSDLFFNYPLSELIDGQDVCDFDSAKKAATEFLEQYEGIFNVFVTATDLANDYMKRL